MKRIWKHVVNDGGIQVIRVPEDAIIRYAGQQGENICLWEEHTIPYGIVRLVDLNVLVVGTGHQFNSDGWTFLNTVPVDDATYIFHVYYRF